MIARFAVDLADVPASRRKSEVVALADALHEEFPAFTVIEWLIDGTRAVLSVLAADTPPTAVARLDGWGHRRLTLAAN